MRKCQIYISYHHDIVTVEELGGINQNFICFNPDRSSGLEDYKIQFTEKIMLKFEGENELISIRDFDDEFIIINSKGEVITDSLNVNPAFVDNLINTLGETGGEGTPRRDMN